MPRKGAVLMSEGVVISHRKARHEYHVLESIEAGIELKGTEVKSLRAGDAQIMGAYAAVEGGEAFLHGAHIDEYEHGNRYNHEPLRKRRLLLHRNEIRRLESLVTAKGMALIPLRIYFRRGRVKVEIGVCRGKRAYDKRQTLKRRTADREAQAALSARRR